MRLAIFTSIFFVCTVLLGCSALTSNVPEYEILNDEDASYSDVQFRLVAVDTTVSSEEEQRAIAEDIKDEFPDHDALNVTFNDTSAPGLPVTGDALVVLTDAGAEATGYTPDELENQSQNGDGIIFFSNEPQMSEAPQESEMTVPETIEVELNESFEAQGLQWVITDVEVQSERQESTDYGDSAVAGQFLVIEANITNTSSEYIAPDSYEVTLYTDQTSYYASSEMNFTVDYERDIFGGEIAPGAEKSGETVFTLQDSNEEPLSLSFEDLESGETVTVSLEGAM